MDVAVLLLPPMLSFGGTFKSSAFVGALTGSWVLAQTVATDTSPFIEKIAREGGFFALVLILLYFYRRDTKWATEFWKEQAARNADMIEANAKQNENVANAIRESTVVMHQAKSIMARQLRAANHREEDTP